MTIGAVAPAGLEYWLRDRYFNAVIDISSSGVENYALGELRQLLGLSWERLDEVVFRDSPSTGSSALREAVADRYVPGGADRIMVTHGSSEAIFLAVAALVGPQDEVVVMHPTYQSLSSIAEALGARLRVWDAIEAAADLDVLAGLLTPRTRLVVVNFPHNPTGTTLDRDQYDALLDLIAGHGAYLLWDGSLTELVYGHPPLPDPAGILPRCVSVGTVSKAFGLPGLRLGWAAGPDDVLARMVRVRDYTTLNTSPLVESLAAAVLRGADRLIGPRRRQAAANRELLLRWAEAHQDLVALRQPAGGVTVFPRIVGLPNTRPACSELMDRYGVLLVPGDCFGFPDRVRIGFGGPAVELADGLEKVAEVMRARVRRPSSVREMAG